MAIGKGYSAKAAFKLETADYGVSQIALNGTGGSEWNQIPFMSESVSPSISYEMSAILDGDAGSRGMYKTLDKYGGDLVIECWYEGMESLIAAVLGASPTGLSPVDNGDGSYLHYFEPSDSMVKNIVSLYDAATPSGYTNRAGTLAFEKDVSVWSFISTMFNSVSFSGTPERAVLTFSVVPYGIAFDDPTNNASDNWTLPPNGTQLLFSDMQVYLLQRDLFLINNSFNLLILNETVDVTLTIPIIGGSTEYVTGYEIAQRLQDQANASTLTGNYIFTYDEVTRTFRIESDVSFLISASSTIDMQMGFSTPTTSALSQMSDHEPDLETDLFQSRDLVGVNAVNFSIENNLDTETQDSLNAGKIAAPERNGMRKVTGSLEIPRYEDDTFNYANAGFTTYGLKISFKGSLIAGANYEEFNVYFPQIKFTNVAAPISGAEIIKQTLSFEAQSPSKYPDNYNFFHEAFKFQEGRDTGSAQNVTCFTIKDDYLYVGQESGFIRRIKEGDSFWETVTTITGSPNLTDLYSYGGFIYFGSNSAEVGYFDGTTWTTSCDFGIGDIDGFTPYNGELYFLDKANGDIYTIDQTTVTLSNNTSSTYLVSMATFNGNLYAFGMYTNNIIYQYNGTTWSTSCDFGLTGTGYAYGMCVHDNRLFVTAELTGDIQHLYSFDGTTWVDLGILNANITKLISHQGNLYGFDGIDGTIKQLHNLYSGIPVALTMVTDPDTKGSYFRIVKKVSNRIVMANSQTNLQVLNPLKDVFITMQNTISTNPLN